MNDPKRVAIVVVLLALSVMGALWVKGAAESVGYKNHVIYTTAVRAEDGDRFNYAIDSQQGNLLANARITADDKKLVKYPEMSKGVIYVKRTKEHYTAHTSCGGKPMTCRTYYSWDTVSTDSLLSEKVSIYGREYAPGIFDFTYVTKNTPCEDIMSTGDRTSMGGKRGCIGGEHYLSSSDRYVYSTVPSGISPTFILNSSNGSIKPVFGKKIDLHDRTIDGQLSFVESYKTVSLWVTSIFVVLLFITACWLCYAWVMEDGVWSTRK